MPVCLWAKDSEPNEKEKAFYGAINRLTSLSIEHLENEYGPDQMIKKERRKPEKIPHLHRFFMRNLFTQKNQRKFYLCLRDRGERI